MSVSVAIYARYSTELQRDASIEDQIRQCQARAAAEGWQVAQCYADHAISGGSLMRPGIQMLMQDALAGKFQIILAEALDRLSRDQEDIAGLFKRMAFAGVAIITLSEGPVSELHVGLKGTMNALYRKDQADKTRRGLEGRVRAGRSAGGKSYGYDVVRRLSVDGMEDRGEFTINEPQAAIVRRIFTDYAAGASPKAIARTLNDEGVPGPSGKGWTASTVHGHRGRGTGILNNELYIGVRVWNRQRFITDPETGKRVSRPNPEERWVRTAVPHLALIGKPLWDAVKARQQAMGAGREQAGGFWDRRRPRYLFSGLIRCGECGGGIVKYSHDRLGCAAARNKGPAVCPNLRTIKRPALEQAVLGGLQERLMDQKLLAIFCEEYTARRNTLAAQRAARFAAERAERDRLDKELDHLVAAIADGVPGSKLKDQIAAKEARKEELEARLAEHREEPVRLHPNMAAVYKRQIAGLIAALNDEPRRAEAAEIVRGLVDAVIVSPDEADGLTIDLHGAIAGILALASDRKKPASLDETGVAEIKLVAGVGFEPTTFRL